MNSRRFLQYQKHCRFFYRLSPYNPKKVFVLTYTYVDDAINKREPLRPSHIKYASDMVDKGILIAGGGFSPLTHGMLLINDSEENARKFAESDPYVVGNIVSKYTVHEWNTEVGNHILLNA